MANNWKPINLMDVLGMASNPVNPGTKFAKRLLNVYPHEKPGALTLRPGYAIKYATPSNSTITNSDFLNFGVFFDRQADPDGEEIICQVQKGILTSLTGSDVANTMKGFWFWVRPYWNGTAWIDQWNWINKTIITKITEVDATYLSHIKIFGNASHGLGDDSLVGWTIYNLTKDQYSKVITCKLDSPDLSINIALYNNDWEVDDIIIASKNWIDIDAQTEFYDNVAKEDIVFHRVNNDLRIGFGGKENRPGLMVGYRKKYFQIKEIDFTNVHADLSEAGAIEKFAKTDGVILEYAIPDNTTFGISTNKVAGTLPANTYYFRLTGLIDGYQEMLLAEALAVLASPSDIEIFPYMYFTTNSLLFDKLNIYKSIDNITFYKIRSYDLRLTYFTGISWAIDETGRLILIEPTELHTHTNAVSRTSEANSGSGWSLYRSGVTAVLSPGANSTSYNLYYRANIWLNMGGYKYPVSGLKRNTTYIVKIYLKADGSPVHYNAFVFFIGASEDYNTVPIVTQVFTGSWVEYTLEVTTGGTEDPTHFVVGSNYGGWVEFDEVSIIEKDPILYDPSITDGTEMSDAMGYTPTFNLVKGWDQALVANNGRIYYLNPYVEKRYENFLLVSAIAPPATFMWDIASFANFRELEKSDGNETIGIELLLNGDILILKNASVTSLSDDGRVGIFSPIIYGVDCVSRSSIVNINGLIFWCGKEEVYLLNIGSSLVPIPLLKKTIRDLYLAIQDKTKIFGTRNRFNTYRIRTNDEVQKTEYLLTDLKEEGWVEERKWNFPEIYRGGFNNKLYFLNNGNIYEEQVDFSLPELPYGEDIE